MTLEKLYAKLPWFYLLVGVCIGLGAGLSFSYFQPVNDQTFSDDQRDATSTYQFVNPLLACGNENVPNLLSNKSSELLKEKIERLISNLKVAGNLSEASVYFRELQGGSWIGINQEAIFTPGSLLKVPLVMSLYLKSEQNPTFLKSRILYEGGTAPATEHFTSEEIKKGSVYSVEDLVAATLIHSDNNAALLLTQLLDEDEVDTTYSQLGIKIPILGQDYTMTVRTYASFFRMLYNATLLNRPDSEHLLALLSQADFTQGIVAGVPPGIVVAHKFGERSYGEGGSPLQLHDCGIVYKKNDPYLLCVMMKGIDYNVLAQNIQAISALVYTQTHS